MIDSKKFLPKAHSLKSFFKKHNFPLAGVAQYLGKSYGYTCNILSGAVRATPEVDLRLKELADMLEKESIKPSTEGTIR